MQHKIGMAWYSYRTMPSLWSYRPARLHRLAGQYNNPMTESIKLPSQGLTI